jgi:hypothetical protein
MRFWRALLSRLFGTTKRFLGTVLAGIGLLAWFLIQNRLLTWLDAELVSQGADELIAQLVHWAAIHPSVPAAAVAFVVPGAYVMRQAHLARREVSKLPPQAPPRGP